MLACVVFLLDSCQREKISGADVYCDSVVCLQNEVVLQMDSFFQSMHYVKYDTPLFYDKAWTKNEQTILALKKLGGYKGNTSLQNASLQVLAVVQHILETDAVQMVKLDSLLLKNYDKSKVDVLDSLQNEAIIWLSRAVEDFDACQMTFLNDFGFDVEFVDEEPIGKEEVKK